MADAENTDEMLDAEESLDSDEIGERAGDDGVDAPDGWAGATKFGTTAQEQAQGETLDQKLAEERPDAPYEEDVPLPGAATPDSQLTESVDQAVDDEEPAEGDETISDDPDLRSIVDS